jgi:hypothetical protein
MNICDIIIGIDLNFNLSMRMQSKAKFGICSGSHNNKRLIIEQSLYTILQILSVSIFEKMPIYQAFINTIYEKENSTYYKLLSLFDIQPDTNAI